MSACREEHHVVELCLAPAHKVDHHHHTHHLTWCEGSIKIHLQGSSLHGVDNHLRFEDCSKKIVAIIEQVDTFVDLVCHDAQVGH